MVSKQENSSLKQNKKDLRVFVVGNGMTKFLKPGKSKLDYPELCETAIRRALRDAGITYSQVEQAYVGYVNGDSCAGQRAVYTVGTTGIPIFNINNYGCTGSSTLYQASKAISSGQADCVLALGFDKMFTGPLAFFWKDRTEPMEDFIKRDKELNGESKTPFAIRIFANAGKEHMLKYGTTIEQFAKIAEKNHRHSANNPYSQFRDVYTLDQILNSQMLHYPLTKLQCCPTSDGAAAAILCSEEFLKKNNLENQAVEMLGISLQTDTPVTFTTTSINVSGGDMARRAAQEVYKKTGVTPDKISVVELHDCFSTNELIMYEHLGLCEEGKGGIEVDKGTFDYGGRCVVCPSGGLLSKGHPIGASGIAQCAELCWQLRGMAEKRQVKDPKYALQHTVGLGGACVVALYSKLTPEKGWSRPDQTSDPDKIEVFEAAEKAKPKL